MAEKYAIDEFMRSVYDMGVRSQGTEMGMARNAKTFDRNMERRQKLIDRLIGEKSKRNYAANKKKGSKGGLR